MFEDMFKNCYSLSYIPVFKLPPQWNINEPKWAYYTILKLHCGKVPDRSNWILHNPTWLGRYVI